MEREANDGISSVMAICLELVSMAAACEDDEVIKDFFISAYTSPLCLSEIRKNDTERAKQVFGSYRPDWKHEQFEEAELLVSGVEFATLMPAGLDVALETRISGALNVILGIYGIPEDVRNTKVKKAFALDYRALGKKAIVDFKKYVQKSNEKAIRELLKIK